MIDKGRWDGGSLGIRGMWRTVAKLAVSALLIWLAFRGWNSAGVFHQILTVNPWALAAALVCVGALIPLLVVRWGAILTALGRRCRFRVLFPISMTSTFFGQTLPSTTGGDVMRVWLAYRAGLSGRLAFSSTVIDRVIGVLVNLLFVTAGLPWLAQHVSNAVIWRAMLATLALAYAAIVVAMFLDLVPLPLRRLKPVATIADLASDLRLVLLDPIKAMAPLAYSVINQIGTIVVVFILAKGLGIGVSVWLLTLIVPLSTLVQAVPISIAGWGIRENFYVLAFGQIGVPSPDALALSVLYGAVILVSSLPGGIIWLARRQAKPADASTVEHNR
ncbi:MAG: lysylphosphatidylglycerol synthase transmembrane domain-containing protein [Stellaceae bacterium]